METIQAQLINLLLSILIALISIGVSYGIKWLRSKGILTKLETNKAIIKDVVNCVEQVSSQLNLHGADKLNAAKTKALEILNSKGITISDSELTTLLENAVKTMNDSAKAAMK